MLTDKKREEFFKIGLYGLCEDLRMGANGSGDMPPDHEDMEEYLLERLLEWKYSNREDDEVFDGLMKKLVKEALHIYRVHVVSTKARNTVDRETFDSSPNSEDLHEDDLLDHGDDD